MLILHKNICCDPSSEPSQRDGSDEGSQHMVLIRNKKNKASQAIQSPRNVPFFLLVSLLDGYSFPNVLVKGIVAFKHKKKKTATLT